MSTEMYKQKVRAQDALALHQVQPLLEQLVCELALARPADPVTALLARLDELDAYYSSSNVDGDAVCAVPPPSRVLTPRQLVCVYGVHGAGKTTQCAMAAAACNGVTLSVYKLLELATKDYDDDDRDDHRTTTKKTTTTALRLRLPRELRQAAHDALTAQQQQQQHGQPPHASTELLTQLLVQLVTQADEACHDGSNNGNNNGSSSSSNGTQHAPVTFLLDDYPHTLEQALALEAHLGAVTCAIELRCPAAVAWHRTSTHASPANNNNNKDDATQQAMTARVQTLSEYWQARGVRRVVDATQDAQACARVIRALLNE